jgi:flavin-dependent dehydrogenase
MAETVHILGAGLSGMVAAIHVARLGREVLVLEAAKGIGGMGGLHPSVHTTPIDPVWMSAQIGSDVTKAFHPVKTFLVGMNEKMFRADPGPLHAVERGARKTSLDALLYKEACEAGVKFEFGTLLKDPRRLPRGSIIATGLHPEMYDYFELPNETSRGFASTSRTEWDTWCAGSMSSYTDDYFYANCANNLMYALLFGRGKVTAEGLEQCKSDIKRKFELDLDTWEYFTGRVPTGSARNPRLFHDKYILAGTLSGAMDPGNLFGIHGAMLSGKVAAMAVENPDRAIREFKRLNRFYSIAYCLKEFFRFMPGKLTFMELTVRYPSVFFPVMAISSLAVPGYRKGFWNYTVMKGVERVQ